jgi:hypothetical protein
VKKTLAAIASALAFIAAPAFVQAAPASDPAAVEATRQMLSAMKIRELTMVSLQQAEQNLPTQVRSTVLQMIQSDTTLNAEQKKEMLARFEKAIPVMVAQARTVFSDPALIDQMVAETVPLYADTYTVDEIHQLSAFYQSPLGQKMLANMPKLMEQSMEISNRVMMPRIQKIMIQTMQDVVGK